MVAGGGASVIYSDTICDLGSSKDLANYGEYSGAPNEGGQGLGSTCMCYMETGLDSTFAIFYEIVCLRDISQPAR